MGGGQAGIAAITRPPSPLHSAFTAPQPYLIDQSNEDPSQQARYSASISIAAGTRGLFCGEPDANACWAISGSLAKYSSSEMPNCFGVGTASSVFLRYNA